MMGVLWRILGGVSWGLRVTIRGWLRWTNESETGWWRKKRIGIRVAEGERCASTARSSGGILLDGAMLDTLGI